MRAIDGRVFYAVFLAALLGLESLLLLGPQALVINGHEGDLIHVLDAASRMALGEWPHSGFMTPLGVLAFKPIAVFLALGFGPGTAIRLALILVAALILPLVWYTGMTRLGPKTRLMFGVWIVIMVTGLVYGGDQATSSVSMYYNRWSWALVFMAALLIVLPRLDRTRRSEPEGAMIGLMLALLALTKVTGFVALAPAVALAYVLHRDIRGALAVAGAGLLVALGVTIAAGGPGYWLDYLQDLLFLARDSARAKPGLDYTAIIANPSYLPGSFCLFISVIALRLFRHKHEGLLLLVLAPGLYYITYQNWGNDPTWLILLATLLIALRPVAGTAELIGVDLRSWHNGLALAALVLISPSVLNVSYSTLRSAALDRGKMQPVYQGSAAPDLLVEIARADKISGKLPLAPIRQADGTLGEAAKPVEFAGESFGECTGQSALIGIYQHFARDMQELGLQDRKIAVADVVNPLWLFGAGARLPGLAPWYYGGPSGLDQAEYVLVPRCPFKGDSRKQMLEEFTKLGWHFDLTARMPHYLLFKRAAR